MNADTQANYRQTLRDLSDRIVAAQKPIRILDHIKWDASIYEQFVKDGGRELPRVDDAYYAARPLGLSLIHISEPTRH